MTTNDTPRPKPAPPKPRPEPAKVRQEAPKEKPKFVRKPHLTEKPFKDSEEMQKLQKSLNKDNQNSTKRPTRSRAFRSQRRSK